MGKKLQIILLIFSLFSTNLFSQAGNAIYLQNSDYMSHGDFIYCGNPDYGFTNELTVAVWIKWTIDPKNFAVTPTNHEDEGYYSTYIAYGSHNTLIFSSDNGQFWFRNAKTGNKFEFLVENTSNVIVTATSVTNPAQDTWYFLTGVYDGTNIYLYVNGVLEKTIAQTGNIKTNDGTHRVSIGRLPWGYGFFVGYIDDIRIWNDALTQTEIQQQMASTSTIKSSNLKSYWNFNASSGTAVDDSGPQNADGVFYSALIDVHKSSSFATKLIEDNDKTWGVNYWQNQTLKTVSGAGIDETNTVTSNTSNTMYVQYGFNGTEPNNRTTPVYDRTLNATWFGVEKTGETSQWVSSDIPLPVELSELSAVPSSEGVILTWQTSTEINNYGFEIESLNLNSKNTVWNKIGFVKGYGNSNSIKEYSFIDKSVTVGKYSYRLKQLDNDGGFKFSECFDVEINANPINFVLNQNYPNPFNPSTTISFSIPASTFVTLKIYDVLGKEVSMLINEELSAGNYEKTFFPYNLSNGIYFYSLKAGKFSETKKMILMK